MQSKPDPVELPTLRLSIAFAPDKGVISNRDTGRFSQNQAPKVCGTLLLFRFSELDG